MTDHGGSVNGDPLRAELQSLEERASRAVPLFETRLRELHGVCDSMVAGKEFGSTDHFAFMALHFNAKQLGHAEAILQLSDHPDTALIARSMLEGLCLLKWTQQDPESRSLQWRSYGLVIDWRTAREQERNGVPGAPARREDLEKRIAERGDALLSTKALDARSKKEPLPSDPYLKTWYRPQIKQIFEAVGAQSLYEGPYFHMSEWHHWSPGGLAQAIWQQDNMVGYSAKSPVLRMGAVATAVQCVAETGEILDGRLALGQGAHIAEIIRSYVADGKLCGFPPDGN